MVRRNSIRVAILSGLAVFVPQALSQSTRPADPQSKQRTIKPEPDRAFIDWLRDIDPIISTAVEVEYALLKDGKELGKQHEDWRGARTNGDRLVLSRLIDSRNLAPGDYAVEVRVKDRVSGQALVQSAKFSMLQ